LELSLFKGELLLVEPAVFSEDFFEPESKDTFFESIVTFWSLLIGVKVL